eukprot:TRINITY_DN14331_c0_g1_i1.p2 TRINITY_DN14331_c0_g1~~TRINITY_DN14331_c0_g1_i1.p2  ORF type:complete len:131 (-),score=26.80 TRINITY_DN14331_c0_g1_i1:292-651(-)
MVECFLMMEELGLLAPVDSGDPAKSGLVMFVSFCVFGAVPLAAYALIPARNMMRFVVSCIVTLIVLVILGIVKGSMTGQNKLRTAVMMTINGGAAAAASFFVAWIINFVAGISEDCGGS